MAIPLMGFGLRRSARLRSISGRVESLNGEFRNPKLKISEKAYCQVPRIWETLVIRAQASRRQRAQRWILAVATRNERAPPAALKRSIGGIVDNLCLKQAVNGRPCLQAFRRHPLQALSRFFGRLGGKAPGGRHVD